MLCNKKHAPSAPYKKPCIASTAESQEHVEWTLFLGLGRLL